MVPFYIIENNFRLDGFHQFDQTRPVNMAAGMEARFPAAPFPVAGVSYQLQVEMLDPVP